MFRCICFPPSYYPEVDGAYILFASGRVGLYHPDVWGSIIRASTVDGGTPRITGY